MGERLEAGDRIITGSVVQAPIEVDDEVVADMGPLGRVGLSIRP
jgi:2-keto-4-pentenoate hydratase